MNNKIFVKTFLKKHFFMLLTSVLVVILVGFFRMYGVTYLNKTIEIVESGVFTGLWHCILLASLIQGLFYFSRWVVAVICSYLEKSCSFELRLQVLRHLNKIPFIEYEKLGVGNVQSIVRDDVDKASLIMYSVFSRVLTNLFMVLFNLAYVIYIDFKVGILIFILSLLISFVNLKLTGPLKQHQITAQQEKGKASEHIVSTVNNYDSIKVYNAVPFLISLFRKPKNAYNYNMLKIVDLKSIRSISVTTITNIITFSGILIIGIGVVNGRNTIGDVIVLSTLMTQVLTPMGILFRWIPSIIASTASWHRVGTIFKLPVTNTEIPWNSDDISKVVFDDLDFSYENGKSIKMKNMTFEKGKIYTITGESGSGKSTVLKIISGVYQADKLRVTIDGKQAKSTSLSSKISYLPPNPMMFSMSIYDNLAMGEDISKEACINILKELGLENWLSSLPDGLNYIVEEGSTNLSGGQKQLISIARVLLSNSPILIMDEPFSALDSEKEEILINLLKRVSSNKIIMFTSHRETTLNFSDEIIAL